MRLRDVALELSRRVVSLFLPNENGRRPCHGDDERYATDPHWSDLVLFYEYFHPETGRGCGARYVIRFQAFYVVLLTSFTTEKFIHRFFNNNYHIEQKVMCMVR